MKHTLAWLIALAAITVAAPQDSFANYGGTGGYQSEAREDDYYYSASCYTNGCPGRCGPGCSTAFGQTVTYQCQQHDNCIRDQRCINGKSKVASHMACLTGSRGLGKAAWSLIQYHFRNNPTSYVSDTYAETPWVAVGS